MAITAHKTPQLVSPAFNPVEFQISSNEQARADFRYKVEVKDGAGAVLNTLYYPGGADAAYKTTIDVSGTLHRLMTFGHWRRDVTGGALLYHSPGFRVQYSVTISEEYDGTLNAVYNSGARYVIPASLNTIRFGSYNYTAIRTAGRWLTDFAAPKVRPADKLTLSYILPQTSGAVTGFVVSMKDRTGAEVDATTITNTESTRVDDVVHIHAGLPDLESIFGPIDTDVVRSYTITPSNGGPAVRVMVEDQDCRHDGARLHFMNEWGGVDSFTFGLSVRKSTKIEKKKAKLPFTSTPLRPSIYGVGPSPYVVTFTDSLKLNSGWLNDAESNALYQLFASPLVAIDVKQNLFFPDDTGRSSRSLAKSILTHMRQRKSAYKSFSTSKSM